MMLPTRKLNVVRTSITTAVLGTTLALAGCPGGAVIDYENLDNQRDLRDFPARQYVDPGVVPNGTSAFTGQVKNYLTAAPVDGVAVATQGITPPVSGTSDGAGSFEITVPVGSVFWVQTYKSGYAYTYDYVNMGAPAPSYEQNLYIVNQTDIDAMATAFGKTQYPGCGVVLATAKVANNPQSNVTVGLTGKDYEGPYYLGPDNTADPNANYTSTSGRFIFFNVCDTGLQTVTNGAIVQLTADGEYYASPKNIQVFTNGLTVATLTVQAGGGPEPEPDPDNVIDFPTQIMPIFAKFACAGCHADDPNAAAYGTGLFFNEYPEEVYYNLTNRPQVVNIQYPDQSYLLTKPLYEDPPDHPNASFPDTYDPDYLQVLQWIESGAPYGVYPPPDPNVPPDFLADVYPIFQNRNCTTCHDAANPDGGLNLQQPAYQVQQYIEQNALINIDYPEYSSLLNNPYCGDNPAKCANDANRNYETHGTEVFVTTDDPDYQTIKRWLEYRAPQLEPLVVDYEYAENVYLEDQIYRFFNLECNRCHSQQIAESGLVLEGTPYQIYQSVTDAVNNGQVVYAGDAEQSYLYTKPNYYYQDVIHSGPKDVPDRLDNYAKYIGGWIQEGAAPPPDVVPTFAEIYPLFNQMGCTGCHNANDNDGNLNLEYDAANPQALYDQVRARVDNNYYIAASSIIYKPFAGNNYLYVDQIHSGNKRLIGNYYNEYTLLQSWIAGGAPGPQ